MPESVRPRPSVLYRWTVLIFISIAMGGNYYIYDSIGWDFRPPNSVG
jgi:hypothetical protein